MKEDNQDYQDFFKEELYDGFVKFLLDKLGSTKTIVLIGDEPVFTKKGVHPQLRRLFNRFLNENSRIEKTFAKNDGKCYLQRNIAGEPLAFPIDVNDESVMVGQDIRRPILEPVDLNFPRAGKNTKRTAEPMKNQILKGDWKETFFRAPSVLIIHFKKSYAKHVGKTTESFKVISKEEIGYLLYDRYKDRVAFAQCMGFKFEFVKRNGTHSKLRSQVQQ